jgi:hypothetical protein
MSRATFSRMEDSTAQDWRVIGGESKAEALPLSEFEPLVRRVFGNVRNSVYKAAIAMPSTA